MAEAVSEWPATGNVPIHTPVLLDQVLAALAPKPGGFYIDGTVGLGGYTEALLVASSTGGRVLGLDADRESLDVVGQKLALYGSRLVLEHSNFRFVREVARRHGFASVNGAALDLGLSSWQLAEESRGFSFRLDAELDMRFDRSQGHTARELVNTLDEEELRRILWEYGEENHGRRIARAIVRARPIRTTGELAGIIERILPRRGRIHPATKTFQALRVAVNDELGALREALPQFLDLLAPGGRLAVVTFHSLEDRIAKELFRRESSNCICDPRAPACICDHRATARLLAKKPIRPSREELQRNPRARSARLRVAEKLGPQETSS